MTKVHQGDKCSFCANGFVYIVVQDHVMILLCDDCAKSFYHKLGAMLVPKGLPNMVVKSLNISTIKPTLNLKEQNQESLERNSKAVEFENIVPKKYKKKKLKMKRV